MQDSLGLGSRFSGSSSCFLLRRSHPAEAPLGEKDAGLHLLGNLHWSLSEALADHLLPLALATSASLLPAKGLVFVFVLNS